MLLTFLSFQKISFLLDDLAKEKGVTAIVDCGVAPGFGKYYSRLPQSANENIRL